MLPMKPIRLALGSLLAADAATLAPVTNANKVALVKVLFTPSEEIIAGDLVLADFDGSTPIAGATGTQLEGIDPVTGEQWVTIKAPAGGWRWETTGITHLPQQIFGFALLDSTLATLIAVELLAVPVSLDAINQLVDLGSITLKFVQQPMM